MAASSHSVDAPEFQEMDATPIEIPESSFMTPQKENNTNIEDKIKGRIFKSLDLAKKFYLDLGREQGFPTRVNSLQRRRPHDDEPNVCVLVCGREGFPKKQWGKGKQADNAEVPIIRRQTSSQKCGCGAKMRVVRNDKGEWVVTLFDEVHNHKFVTPGPKRILMKANRMMPEVAKSLSVAFNEENLPIGKVCSVLSGATIGFSERDCRNHLNASKKYKTPVDGDATAAFNYFKKKNAEDPHFFYNIQTDVDGRAINFFWVDGRSRLQYSHFGDVVCFDTTYKTNVYCMPFGPFTGVNHHLQSIQFGCALLLDESEESFVWLFETWLVAMGGKAPISLITDQDLAMTAAVAKVFPNTRHRFCLWHIESKFPEYFAHIYHKNDDFANDLRKCLWWPFRKEDFETRWSKLLVDYGLQEHPWLKSLHEMREKWVPVYNYNTFYAGMNTTGRSEGMNAFYKDYFTHTTTLRDFVSKYDKCVDRIQRREREEDYRTEHFDRILHGGLVIQKIAAKLYTRNAFEKFDKELQKALCEYKVHKDTPSLENNIYVIKSRKIGDHVEWFVSFNVSTMEGSCECNFFEFWGIPCGHLLKVFLRNDIDVIPTCFVRRRWKQRANQYRVNDGVDLLSCAKDSMLLRILHGSQLANQVVSEAAVDDERFKMLVDALTNLSEQYATLNATRASQVPRVESPNLSEQPPLDSPNISFKNPNISKTKGRPKGKPSDKAGGGRLKRGIEISQDGGGRYCSGCDKMVLGHDKRNCPNPKIPRPEIQPKFKRPRRGKSQVMNDDQMNSSDDDDGIESLE